MTELLAQAAQVFAAGAQQINALTLPTRLLSATVFADVCRFFDEELPAFLAAQGLPGKKLKPHLASVSRNLRRFQERVAALPATAPYARGEDGLLDILTQSWGWEKGLDGAAVILDAKIAASQAALQSLAAAFNPNLSWTGVLEGLPLPEHRGDLLSLYRREIQRLEKFWENSPVLPRLRGRVEVAPTPLCLRGLRSSASYAAPWGPPAETPGYF